MCNEVTLGSSSQSRVMRLLAADGMLNHKIMPHGINPSLILQQPKQSSKHRQFHFSLSWTQPESIIGQRTSGYRPILVKDLWHQHQVVSVTSEQIDRLNTKLKVGVTRLSRSQQNVGVDKDTHQSYMLSRLSSTSGLRVL